MGSPTDTSAWQALQAHSEQFKRPEFRLQQLFKGSTTRFRDFSLQHEGLLLDFSKNFLTPQTLDLLIDLALQQQVPDAIAAMFAGDAINGSEQRPAMHIALREPATACRFSEVTATLARMDKFVTQVQKGEWQGYSGKPISDVVNLGVGGSDLGPALAVRALQHTVANPIRMHFVSNIDPLQIDSALQQLDPETTLFIVASKSFTTLETLHNASRARIWLTNNTEEKTAVNRHFVAVTSNVGAARNFGIDASNCFPLWDWVGGRYSMWSAIGLPIALSLGMKNFYSLLAGAHAMDEHFRRAALQENLPVILALLSVWYRGFFDAHSSALIPYGDALKLLPAYIQQLAMESLGKSVDRDEQPVNIHTGEPIWGTVGTDAQHSCFQLLHQGTEFVPVDFIVSARAATTEDNAAHQHLLANCFSQSLALMTGQQDTAAPYRNISGNKPSNTLLLSELTPYSLGSLLALYEHKVYVQSVIWNINAFDQWGVELGKQLSQNVFNALNDPQEMPQLDDSTRNLIKLARDWG